MVLDQQLSQNQSPFLRKTLDLENTFVVPLLFGDLGLVEQG
jgi:hypothetical protein